MPMPPELMRGGGAVLSCAWGAGAAILRSWQEWPHVTLSGTICPARFCSPKTSMPMLQSISPEEWTKGVTGN